MTNKKNKFLTFCFSLLPGAGEMYLGFYKMGVSLMALFFFLIVFTGTLNLTIFGFLLPVIWFYSFFHVHNLNSLPDDEFYALEDYWIFSPKSYGYVMDSWFKQYQKLIAGLLIFLGVCILWKFIRRFMYGLFQLFGLSQRAQEFFFNTNNSIPQVVVAIFIIFLGIRLIREKKDSLEREENNVIPSPPYIETQKTEETQANE